MRIVKYLIAASAFVLSTNAYAINLLGISFSGVGSGRTLAFDRQTGFKETYIDRGFFSASFFVDLDVADINSNSYYTSNGINSFYAFGNPATSDTNVNLVGNGLNASFGTYNPYLSQITVSASFKDLVSRFADLTNVNTVTGGSFDFTESSRSGDIRAFGTITSVSAFAINAPFSPSANFLAVPEPSTWAMMLAGFGLIGFAVRKRSSVKTTIVYA